MNSEELKNIIELARIDKGISQRELAKQTGISRSTLNDLINGKIKKVDIDDLRKIAEILEVSLQELLKVAGYDKMISYFSKDKYANKSSKDLKEIIDQYKKSELELLDFDARKRKNARKTGVILYEVIETLEKKDSKDSILEKTVEDLKKAQELIKPIEEKYDYSKLPKSD